MHKKSGKKTFKDIVEDVKNESGGAYRSKKTKVQIIPKNVAQEEYFTYLSNPQKRIIFAVGSAGTGKTMLAVLQAIKDFKEGNIDKIVITRPTVTVDDEKFGFLPGDINAKLEPWTKPIFDVFEEYWSTAEIQRMVYDKYIEICPFAFLRGRTFHNCAIIADECQNSTVEQLKVLLTRMGSNSRVFVTGDMRQTDRRGVNGLEDFLGRIEGRSYREIAVCYFTKAHVERDPIVTKILTIYGED